MSNHERRTVEAGQSNARLSVGRLVVGAQLSPANEFLHENHRRFGIRGTVDHPGMLLVSHRAMVKGLHELQSTDPDARNPTFYGLAGVRSSEEFYARLLRDPDAADLNLEKPATGIEVRDVIVEAAGKGRRVTHNINVMLEQTDELTNERVLSFERRQPGHPDTDKIDQIAQAETFAVPVGNLQHLDAERIGELEMELATLMPRYVDLAPVEVYDNTITYLGR